MFSTKHILHRQMKHKSNIMQCKTATTPPSLLVEEEEEEKKKNLFAVNNDNNACSCSTQLIYGGLPERQLPIRCWPP